MSLVALAMLLTAQLHCPDAPDVRSLDDLRWKARVLLLFAPTPDDARLARQWSMLDASRAGLDERALRIVTVAPGVAPERAGCTGDASLAERHGVAPGTFAVVLVGKDGGDKARWTEPVPAEDVFARIDAMPMRRSEQSKRR